MRTPCLAALLLAPALAAQGSVVSPADFTIAEASTSSSNGIATSATPARLLVIHDDLKGQKRTINSVAYRPDYRTRAMPAFSVVVDVVVSTATTKASSPNKTFSANHGTDKKKVAGFKLVRFPATRSTPMAAPFDYKVPFGSPFSFAGNGPLAVDVTVKSRTNSSSFSLDFASGRNSNPPAVTERIGSGCKVSGQTSAMFLSGSSSPNWPQSTMTLRWNGSRGPKSKALNIMIGANNRSWAGLTLPFVIPGSQNAPSGTCRVYNDWIVPLPAITDSRGSFQNQIGFQTQPFFTGANIYSQAVALDASAVFGVVMSNQVHHHLVTPWKNVPVGSVWTNSLSPTGRVRAHWGPVTKFE